MAGEVTTRYFNVDPETVVALDKVGLTLGTAGAVLAFLPGTGPVLIVGGIAALGQLAITVWWGGYSGTDPNAYRA